MIQNEVLSIKIIFMKYLKKKHIKDVKNISNCH